MRIDFREIIANCSLIGIFLGFLLIDICLPVGAVVTLVSLIVFTLMEKGII